MTEPHPACNCPMYGTSACSKYRLWHGCESHSSAKESSDKVLNELENKMKSYFDTGYESEDLQFVEDCFKELRTKEREG